MDGSSDAGASRGVLVTGASRGIGAATARAFAALGDRVALGFSTSREQAEAVRDALPGQGHTVVQADLADPVAVQAMASEAWAELGGIDVLVNNAAVFAHHPIADVDYAGWQAAWARTLAVNLVGTANLSWCVARLMIDRQAGGRIVNISSRGAFRGEPRAPAYGASKAGLNALGQSLARALGPHGIAVASIAPGYVETEMITGLLDAGEGAQMRAQSPFARVARPEEVAAAVVYLASPLAEWASGAVLDLNGASYLR